MLNGHHLPVLPRTALDLVDHEQDAVTVADGTQLAHEVVRCYNVAAFALDWLDKDGGDLFRSDGGLEELFLDVTGASELKASSSCGPPEQPR